MNLIEKIKFKKIRHLFITFLLSIFNFFYGIKKFYRRLILFVIDSLLILISINIVTYFLYPVSDSLLQGISISNKYDGVLPNSRFFLILVIIIYIVFNLTGQYISLSRYINSKAIYGIAFRNLLVFSIYLVIKVLLGSTIFDLRQFILLLVISTILISIVRFGIKEINIFLSSYKSLKIRNVAIYGAGEAGAQLASSLILAGNTKIVAFFDDSKNLKGRKLLGFPILSPQKYYFLKIK